MDDLFAISSWQDQQINIGMGKHSWINNNIDNFNECSGAINGSNTYHCSTILNNTSNDSMVDPHHSITCNSNASSNLRASSMAPCPLAAGNSNSTGKRIFRANHQHPSRSVYGHVTGNMVQQYDDDALGLSARAAMDYIGEHQITSAGSQLPTANGPVKRETMLPIETSYLGGKELWTSEEASWRKHRPFSTANGSRGQGRVPVDQVRAGSQQRPQPQINATVANGNSKPRPRARRGQATDPHSIAERHRRERIAEKVKQLHELVPDLNKADRAAMLDEIISYVKFLQLQMTVLNMNKLGSTGSVISSDVIFQQCQTFSETPTPLGQSSVEISNTSVNHSNTISKDEEEAVKLMESDMGSAMRFLQKKGLCLMPISLAGIICSKDSSSTTCFINPNES